MKAHALLPCTCTTCQLVWAAVTTCHWYWLCHSCHSKALFSSWCLLSCSAYLSCSFSLSMILLKLELPMADIFWILSSVSSYGWPCHCLSSSSLCLYLAEPEVLHILLPALPHRTSTASSRSQWASLGLHCQLSIAVGLAGPPLPALEPDLICQHLIAVGLAGPQLLARDRCGPRRASTGEILRAVGLAGPQPHLNGQKQSHIECQRECQKICQIECQKICQIE